MTEVKHTLNPSASLDNSPASSQYNLNIPARVIVQAKKAVVAEHYSFAKGTAHKDHPEEYRQEWERQWAEKHGDKPFPADHPNASKPAPANVTSAVLEAKAQLRRQTTPTPKAHERCNTPPHVRERTNKNGDVIGVTPVNHADNLRWLAENMGVRIARNLMTWEVEILDAATGERLTNSEAKTHSDLIGAAALQGMPKDLINCHLDAVAEDDSYHPVKHLLDGKKWDGVRRVQAVFDCLPVAPGDIDLRNALLWADAVGSIAALDDGAVSMKIVPTLFSEANDWFKTAYLRCVGAILPGSFQEGADMEPGKKDSVRKFIRCWRAELGEVDKLTTRESGAVIKAFIPQDADTWRPEHSRTYVTKPRQTTACATVNKEDFIKDKTASSRMPVISLSAPIDIERVNEILGWKMIGGRPCLIQQENLIQFWLEVRHARNVEGKTHQLQPEVLERMKADNDKFVAKDEYLNAVLDALSAVPTKRGTFGVGSAGEWFSPSEMCASLHIPMQYSGRIGRVLAVLEGDGYLRSKRVSHGKRYQLINTPDFQLEDKHEHRASDR